MVTTKRVRLSTNCTVEAMKGQRTCIGYMKDGKHVKCNRKVTKHSKSGRCPRCNGAWVAVNFNKKT